MLEAVTGLQQVAQDGAGDTTFGWTFVPDADGYDLDVDGVAAGQAPQPTATITGASPGTHTLGVAPFADPTPPTVLEFAIPETTTPPQTGSNSTPLLIGAGIAAAALVGAVALSGGRKGRERR